MSVLGHFFYMTLRYFKVNNILCYFMYFLYFNICFDQFRTSVDLSCPCNVQYSQSEDTCYFYFNLFLSWLCSFWWNILYFALFFARWKAGVALLNLLHILGIRGALHLKPKAHVFAHVIDELHGEGTPTLNPWFGCTWRDEDFIGKMMRMVKACHASSVPTRPMEFYAARLRLFLG